MRRETMTVVLGTSIVKMRPAKKALIGFLNVALMRFHDFGMLKISVMYFSTPPRARISVAPPIMMPAQAGITS